MENKKHYYHDLYNDRFFDLVFNQKEKGYFVELGAYQGVFISQTYFLETERNWDGIIVEPNPKWLNELNENRKCKIITNPISNEETDVTFLLHNVHYALSKIDDGNSTFDETEIERVQMKSTTLSNLLKDSPQEIDVLAMDIEGMELKVLEEYFANSNKKINLIALEHYDTHKVIDFFYNKPYIKIKNPYLNYLKIDRGTNKMVEYNNGEFYYLDGPIYTDNIMNLYSISWEYYFIHIDMLKQYPYLKELIEPIDYLKLNS